LSDSFPPPLPGPPRAARRDRVRAWSAGCASGEEAYTLVLLWDLAMLEPELEVLATDVHEPVLARARAARYEPSSLRELPATVRERGFDAAPEGGLVVRSEHRRRVTVARHDLHEPPPAGPFDLVLCRNVAFTYFAPDAQPAVLAHLAAALRPGGALVLGLHEALSDPAPGFAPWPGARAVHRYVPAQGDRREGRR
jgi:chemotaxis protein methyltransferase CheR